MALGLRAIHSVICTHTKLDKPDYRVKVKRSNKFKLVWAILAARIRGGVGQIRSCNLFVLYIYEKKRYLLEAHVHVVAPLIITR